MLCSSITISGTPSSKDGSESSDLADCTYPAGPSEKRVSNTCNPVHSRKGIRGSKLSLAKSNLFPPPKLTWNPERESLKTSKKSAFGPWRLPDGVGLQDQKKLPNPVPRLGPPPVRATTTEYFLPCHNY